MQATIITCVLALTSAPTVLGAIAKEASPISKVIELLSSLEAKIMKEGAASQKTYDEFAEWCEDRSKELSFEIKTLESEKEGLEADIANDKAEIAALHAKIEEVTAEIHADEKDLAAASDVREKEKADFLAEDAELSETISAIERAITIIEREMAKSSSLLQAQTAGNLVGVFRVLVKASFLSTADADRLTGLVQTSEQEGALGAPAAAAYESSSGGIVTVLEDLLDKAKNQLDTARKAETASENEYELLAQNLEDSIKYATKEVDEAKKKLAETEAALAAAEGDLAVCSKSLAAAVAAKAELHQDCMDKAQDFELETSSRGQELKALAAAKKAISESTSGEGGAAEITYGLNQEAVSLLQVGRENVQNIATLKALRLVRDLARTTKSTALTQLASRMAATLRYGSGDDQFAKVKGLIRDLIERLIAQAKAEAEEKAYCDKELAETRAKKEDKMEEIAKLTAAIDKMAARIAVLKKEIAALAKSLADLAASQAAMDKMRTEEHAEYVSQKAEMEEGLQGVKLALKILKEYYGGEAHHEAATGEGEGIIGLIEVIESDMTKTLTEIEATEKASAAEYDRQTKENEIMAATWSQDVKYKTKEQKELEEQVSQATSDRSSVQAELDAVLEYLKHIEDRCIAKPMTYEERVRRREAEIAGLKEALEILSGEDVLAENERRAAEALLQTTVAKRAIRGGRSA